MTLALRDVMAVLDRLDLPMDQALTLVAETPHVAQGGQAAAARGWARVRQWWATRSEAAMAQHVVAAATQRCDHAFFKQQAEQAQMRALQQTHAWTIMTVTLSPIIVTVTMTQNNFMVGVNNFAMSPRNQF